MFKKKRLLFIPAALLLGFVVWMSLRGGESSEQPIKVPVKSGKFVISVTTSGELEAKSSENILGPVGLRTVGIWSVQISELIPEGSVVKEGDWIATLDRSEISNRMKDLETELEKLTTQFTKTKLDTSLELRNARDELINLRFSMEESRITLDQSKFEPPAAIRQAEIALDKTDRAYNQAVKNYELRFEQAKARMQEVSTSLAQTQRRYDNMISVIKDFEIRAPKDGMVIYRRSWDGTKVTVGSQISSWENIVATLPDFSVMMSKTFVNEIDISKIKLNQIAEIGVDAFPEKRFTGMVVEVANIGEQRPNSDSKVFEVKVRVNEFDSILRPAMTTKNTIITSVVEDAVFIPMEALHGNDGVNWVYKQSGSRIQKQQVVTGDRNENEIIILEGLEPTDHVYLHIGEKERELPLIELKPAESGK